MSDKVNSPKHYTADPSGVECITITRHRTFNIGNAIKYCWRGGLKVAEGAGAAAIVEDYNKALWYLCDEIQRLGGHVTCRHGAMVKALLADAEAAPRKAPDAAPLRPAWVRLINRKDPSEVRCSGCGCNWWERANGPIVTCAKCGTSHINTTGAEYTIAFQSIDKPEL